MKAPPTHTQPATDPGFQPAGNSQVAKRGLSHLVTSVFEAWKAGGVSFLALRNYERLPEQVDNDLDILVAPGQLQLAEKILVQSAEVAGYILHQRAEFVPVSLFFHHSATLEQVQVDLFSSLGYRLFNVVSTEEALKRRSQGPLFATPDPVDEAIVNLLTRLLYQGRVKDKYRPGILQAVRSSPQEARARLAGTFGPEPAAFLVEAAASEKWTDIERRAKALRRTLVVRTLSRHPGSLCRSALKDAGRLLRRWVRPPGLSIAILGPDGCGKSTVVPRIIEALRYTFAPDKGLQIHWKPIVFFRKRRLGRPPTTNPHGRPPRGRVASLLFLAYHWAEYFLGAFTQMRRVRFRNGLVMIDRHYYDFLVDPRRYRLNAPVWAVRLGGALLPKPDLVFLLDAPAEVLQSRKQEVPVEETERQRNAFLNLVKSLKNGHVVEASRSPEEVASSVVRTVLEHMAARNVSRDVRK